MLSNHLIVILALLLALCREHTTIAIPFFSHGKAATPPKGLWSEDPNDYGVDWSTPIHHRLSKDTWFGEQYYKMMQGCYDKYSKHECDGNEDARIEMNLDQPRTQHNYTQLGFKKFNVPEHIFKEILKFYEDNKAQAVPEQWPRANTYVNSWASQTLMVSFENSRLRGGMQLKQRIWDEMKPIVEEWTGKKLIPTSLYGIREYKRGAVLATHVDRLPLVSSLIIQVSQNVDEGETWPIEVYSHDGKAYNVSMKPGEGVLYESHTVLHGRPFPLKGDNYANIFVHFIPIDHDKENEQDAIVASERSKKPPSSTMVLDLEREMKNQLEKGRKTIAGHEQDNHPKHVIDTHIDKNDKLEIERLKRENEELEMRLQKQILEKYEEEEKEKEEEEEDLVEKPEGRTALHEAAASGDIETVTQLLKRNGVNTEMIHAKDENDWQAIHEAARGGYTEVIQYLIDMGADVGAKTNNGGTPLWWARQSLAEDHEAIQLLVGIGAPEGDII